MIKIRQSVFETNSSSSHSIVIKKGGGETLDKIDPEWRVSENGDLYIWDSDLEFGRSPFDILCGWYHKLCYAIASYGEDKFDEIESLVLKHVKRACYITLPERWNDDDERVPFYGYVDHQSMDLLTTFLRNNDVTLEDFIFNDKYVVIIDGDEYCVFERLERCGLLDESKIESRWG